MNWNVTYRAKDGKQAVLTIEAETREALFKTLASKSISVIRVEAATGTKTGVLLSFKTLAWVVVGVVAVVCGTFVVLSLNSGGEEQAPQPAVAKKPRVVHIQPVVHTNIPVAKVEKPDCDKDILSIRRTINPFTGEEMIFTNRHKQVKANAGVISRDSLQKNKHQPKRKLFKHHSENYICGLMRTPLGVPIVRGRLPKNFDDDFVKSYAEEIRIEPEDTEEDIALKQAMIDFKEEIRDQIAQGASVSKIVLEAREEQNKLAEYRKNLMKTIADLRREGASRDELNEAREAANVMLERKGLKRIPSTDLPRKGEVE